MASYKAEASKLILVHKLFYFSLILARPSFFLLIRSSFKTYNSSFSLILVSLIFSSFLGSFDLFKKLSCYVYFFLMSICISNFSSVCFFLLFLFFLFFFFCCFFFCCLFLSLL